jgi:hypothetical protein
MFVSFKVALTDEDYNNISRAVKSLDGKVRQSEKPKTESRDFNISSDVRRDFNDAADVRRGVDVPFDVRRGVDVPFDVRRGVDDPFDVRRGVDVPFDVRRGVDVPFDVPQCVDVDQYEEAEVDPDEAWAIRQAELDEEFRRENEEAEKKNVVFQNRGIQQNYQGNLKNIKKTIRR